jgi:hypothetical protein
VTEAAADQLLGAFPPADALDRDYLNEWAGKLGVESLWQRLRAEAAPL